MIAGGGGLKLGAAGGTAPLGTAATTAATGLGGRWEIIVPALLSENVMVADWNRLIGRVCVDAAFIPAATGFS